MEPTFSENIEFLNGFDSKLYSYILRSAQLYFEDKASSEVALRKFAEHIVTTHLLPNGPSGLFASIEQLRAAGNIPQDILDQLDELRKIGNRSAHTAKSDLALDGNIDPIKTAYEVASWLFIFKGGDETLVPIYISPTPAEGYKIFRDAVLGGEFGYGDPLAQYYVALALNVDERAWIRKIRGDEHSSGRMPSRRQKSIELLRQCVHFVPAARSMLASLLLNPPCEAFTSFLDPPKPRKLSEDELYECFDLLQWAADDNDPEGHFRLGVWYLYGEHGYDINKSKAKEHFEAAAAQEHPGAYNALFTIYYNSEDEGERKLSKELVRKSAEAGFGFGQFHYGCLLMEYAIEADDDSLKSEALNWLLRSLKQEVPQTMFYLGQIILQGHITQPPTVDVPHRLINDASCRGLADAMVWQAKNELAKNDSDTDFSLALSLLNNALKADYPLSSDHTEDVLTLLQNSYKRFTKWLEFFCSAAQYPDMSYKWYHFKSDGTLKFKNNAEFSEHLGIRGMSINRENLRLAYRGPRKKMVQELKPTIIKNFVKDREPGRNAPCHCGSGAKYKKCCLKT